MTLFMFLPSIDKESEYIVKRCKRKFNTKKKVKFNVKFSTTKLSFFTSNKDKMSSLSNSYVVYEYTCPGSSQQYIGKTESTLFKGTKEHGWQQNGSAVLGHLKECNGWHRITKMFECMGKELQINNVQENIKIPWRLDNWLKLAFLDPLAIKEDRPALTTGIKASKELCLF